MSTTKNYPRSYTFGASCKHWVGCPRVYSPASDQNPTYVKNAVNSVTYGDNLKDWRQRIAAGQSATTTLSGTRYGQMICGSGNMSYYNSCGIVNSISGNIFGADAAYATPFTGTDPVAERKAVSKYLQHYIEAKNKWRGGNFVAEVRETIHMLRHPVKSFYQHTWDFAGRVGKFKNVFAKRPADYAKELSNAWLAYVFGAKPLIDDINDATTAANTLKAKRDNMDQNIVNGFGRNTTISRVLTPKAAYASLYPGGGTKYDRITKSDNTVRYHSAIAAQLNNTTTTLEHFGFGVYDAAPAVWEAVPWSFLVDYFLNVQEMIDSMRLFNVDSRWCNRTVRNSTTLNFQNLRIEPPIAGDSMSVSGDRFYSLAQFVSRAPSSVPSPSWTFKIPGVDSMRWLNIAALSQQIRQSAPRSVRDVQKLGASIKK